jgi:hypothetical protein
MLALKNLYEKDIINMGPVEGCSTGGGLRRRIKYGTLVKFSR